MKLILSGLVVLIASQAFAGAGSHGNDPLRTRYELTRQSVVKVMDAFQKKFGNTHLPDPELEIFRVLLPTWKGRLKNAAIEPMDKKLFDHGEPKEAVAEGDSHIYLSRPYFEVHGTSRDEIFVNEVHESGHLAGIYSESLLDSIGLKILNFSKRSETVISDYTAPAESYSEEKQYEDTSSLEFNKVHDNNATDLSSLLSEQKKLSEGLLGMGAFLKGLLNTRDSNFTMWKEDVVAITKTCDDLFEQGPVDSKVYMDSVMVTATDPWFALEHLDHCAYTVTWKLLVVRRLLIQSLEALDNTASRQILFDEMTSERIVSDSMRSFSASVTEAKIRQLKNDRDFHLQYAAGLAGLAALAAGSGVGGGGALIFLGISSEIPILALPGAALVGVGLFVSSVLVTEGALPELYWARQDQLKMKGTRKFDEEVGRTYLERDAWLGSRIDKLCAADNITADPDLAKQCFGVRSVRGVLKKTSVQKINFPFWNWKGVSN